MKKNIKKIGLISLMAFIIFSIFSNVYADDLKTSLEIIQKASETKYLENNQGYISKTIVESNSNTGEVTVELKLSNTKKVEQTGETEVFLVVDNSPSMDFVTSTGKTRKELVLNSATQLVTSIFNASSKIKVGLIDFHGETGGIFGESASIYNATVRQKLTNDKGKIMSEIQNQLQRNTVGGTNIDAGLQRAQKSFSESASNKIVILLTDGIPNADVNGTSTKNANDVTDDGIVQIGVNTKNTILKLKEAGIYTITLLTGMSEQDGNTDKNGTEYKEVNTIEEQLKAAEAIFGTTTNPTADKYYLVSSVDINKIIEEDILQDVTKIVQNPINTIKITDYFPKDITDNFEFSYVGKPNVGTVSEGIDSETNTIEWNIDTLKGDEVATLRYKLKIKDMKNEQLLNKTIATNEKVVLTYKDINAKDYTVILESSPKIQLSKVIEAVNNGEIKIENNNDSTIATGKLPQAGKSIKIVFIIILAILISIGIYKRYHNFRDIK